jgi:hypothetical protein
MVNSQKSSSIEQMRAEEKIFVLVEKSLKIHLEKNPKLYLANNKYTCIQPDFYSAEHYVIGEIFAHIGKPKKSQDNKISHDILKMLLLEKSTGKTYRKILAVCDEQEWKKLTGKSVLAESIRQFDIEVLLIPIEDSLKRRLLETQIRQKMINA